MPRCWLMSVMSAALLGVASSPGSAAPMAGADALRSTFNSGSALQKAAYRCWWRAGARRCSWSGPRVYGYASPGVYGYYYRPPRTYGYGYLYGRPRPEAFPTGSTAWWRAMDYEGRGGHGRGGP